MNQTLYHYCSVDAFSSIIVNKEVWLSDAFSSNDYSEMSWFLDTVRRIIEKRRSIDVDFFQYVSQYVELCKHNYFLLCFSGYGDMLSQWRAYGGDGTGFSIGFNKDYFKANDSLPNLHAIPGKSLFLSQVSYWDRNDLLKLEDEIDKYLDQMFNDKKSRDELAINFQAFCGGFSKIVKNPCFSEEKESRLIFVPILTSDAEGKVSIFNKISEMKWRSSSGRIIPYFTLSLGENREDSPVVEVILGPKCKESEGKVKLFLDHNEFYGVRVTRSLAPYR